MSNSQITKLALVTSMEELMEEKSMSKITISDITNKCGLSRKSFYYHFKDKYDLVSWKFHTDFISVLKKTEEKDVWTILERICDYLYTNKNFYSNALKVKGQNSFSDYFIEVLEPFMLLHFGDIFDKHENKESFSIYFADITRVALSRWLINDDDVTPENFILTLRKAVEGLAFMVTDQVKKE